MAAFAKITEAERERLEMLAEEASEVIKAVTKILRHGYYSRNPNRPDEGDNRKQLEREITDFRAIADRMEQHGEISLYGIAHQLNDVWLRKLPFTHHQPGDVWPEANMRRQRERAAIAKATGGAS